MLRAIAVALVVSCVACSSTPEKEQESRRAPTLAAPTSAELPRGGIVRTSRGAGFVEMIEELAEADVVYVGESHDDPDHHLVQLRVIEQLHARGRLHAIGMEMFERRFQAALDDYTQARIGEQELLERTEFGKRWGFEFKLYRAILQLARKWRLPVIALELEDEIREKAAKGGLDALSQAERETLPAVDLGNADHRAFMRTVHQRIFAGTGIDAEPFERFYAEMCLREAVMADCVVRWFRTAPKEAQIVVLAGCDHVENRVGVPDRVRRRIGKRHKTLIPLSKSADRTVHAEGFADFVWMIQK